MKKWDALIQRVSTVNLQVIPSRLDKCGKGTKWANTVICNTRTGLSQATGLQPAGGQERNAAQPVFTAKLYQMTSASTLQLSLPPTKRTGTIIETALQYQGSQDTPGEGSAGAMCPTPAGSSDALALPPEGQGQPGPSVTNLPCLPGQGGHSPYVGKAAGLPFQAQACQERNPLGGWGPRQGSTCTKERAATPPRIAFDHPTPISNEKCGLSAKPLPNLSRNLTFRNLPGGASPASASVLPRFMRTASQGQERHPDGRQDGAVKPLSLGEPLGLCPTGGTSFLPFPSVPGKVPPFRASTKSAKEEIQQAAAGDFCLEALWLSPGSNQGRVFGSLACLPPLLMSHEPTDAKEASYWPLLFNRAWQAEW
ncbi:hypothetical protein E2320_007254 [Naja naja]|nr:hypothetical protein E2320_007254 [Naja naja]